MKLFNWNPDKNQQLIQERGLSFESVVFHINQGHVLDDLKHPNQAKYPNQRMLVINIDDYAYLVPYVENEKEYFLKTVIPSRKATKQYLGDQS